MTSFKEWPSDGGPHTSDSIGQADAGLVARDASGNPISGMLAPPTITAVTGAWKVQVGRFVYLRNVAGGARRSGLSAAEQVDIANAAGIPAGQSRIDLIVWDAVSAALSVVTGTPAASPSVPTTVFVPVARVLVKSGDAQVIPAQITPVFVKAALASNSGGHAVSPLNSGSAPIDPERLVMKSGRHTGSTDSFGVMNVPFPEAFENALVSVQQIVGHETPTGLLVFHSTNKNQAQFFFPNAPSSSRTVVWVAWGY